MWFTRVSKTPYSMKSAKLSLIRQAAVWPTLLAKERTGLYIGKAEEDPALQISAASAGYAKGTKSPTKARSVRKEKLGHPSSATECGQPAPPTKRMSTITARSGKCNPRTEWRPYSWMER